MRIVAKNRMQVQTMEDRICLANLRFSRQKQGKKSQGCSGSKLRHSEECNDLANGAVRRQSSRITSSARWRTAGGMVMPRAWAVLRLRTSSNLVACPTLRAAGLA